ncbi:MAG: FAD-dependent oxidoreductase [Clostridiales bacterium]|nr:FAD-dependent oxidoreductase [Clostridiales bacterium]
MKINTEIAIIGAGPAGVSAAIAAAKLGNQVVLIGNRPVLGGNSSSEIRVWTRGAVGGGNLYAEEMGVWGEVKLRALLLNPEANPVLWDDVLLEQVTKYPAIQLLLNTHITTINQDEDRRLTHIMGFQMGSEKQVQISAKYFIDATGDGTIGHLAKIPYVMGQEDCRAYGENLAPEKEGTDTFGNTIFFYTKKEEKPIHYTAPDFAYTMEETERLLGGGGRVVNEHMNGCDYWWFETGGTKDTIKDAQDIAFELRRLVLGVWNYIKNSGKYQAEKLTLSWIGSIPGKRESRRMITQTVLTQQDILEQKTFKDAAFYGGWYMDFHPSDGIHAIEESCEQIPVQVYSIPLGTLYNPLVENLLFAGRNIGVSHVAFSSTRIMNTCALSGQAAATLASYCIAHHAKPETLKEEQYREIQQILLREDMLLPGIKNQDLKDLTVKAVLSTEEGCITAVEEEKDSRDVTEQTFVVAPFGGGKTAFLFEATEETSLTYNCYWSLLPSRAALGKELEGFTVIIPKGKNWVFLPMGTEEKGFCTFLFQKNPLVKIAESNTQLTGVLGGKFFEPCYWYPCVKFEKGESLYGVQNLLNGYNRPWQGPNVWAVKGKEKPSVTFTWDKPQTVSQIVLYGNPDLSKELTSGHPGTWSESHKFCQRTQMPPQLLREVVIYGKEKSNDDYRLLGQIKDNWKRKMEITLPQNQKVVEIKVVLVSNYGGEIAEVFEIRIY